MSVDRAEVARIAELARLRLDTGEVERLTSELNSILEHMEAMRGLAEEAEDERPVAVLPSTRATEEAEPDALGDGPSTFAPRWAEGFFVVPPPPGVHDGESTG